ncbi:type VII secretion target [Lentzea sp. NPDC059081]|uniref:type VII secretion target n=1 Tax=Lentzea sp. NPDC059081 TaxID=3346719 RepID=UPI00368D793C
MTANVFGADSAELRKVADGLVTEVSAELAHVRKSVDGLCGFNVNAFGVFAAQVLGAPCRISLAALADDLRGLVEEVDSLAAEVHRAAAGFERVDQENAEDLARPV